ncbi:uncharacterized protein N7459_000266 [Penicillium hispanicum]|uniref:uncharacterized protein n=1 Tax=Penicillium hispanicum TaxID=1080232 RepID=UPI002541F279|nr:uncharacterized protein N7459_000266 [Penicillium hispanicum]KAJ5594058.1 hypothetical protein N7459_000266 [Penicillium hispanicum]
MDFDHYAQSSRQPRQRRRRTGKRRLHNKPPVGARLALDPQLRGHIGVLSEDLANDLFSQEALQGAANGDGILYVAVCPHSPTYTSVEDQAWTVLPIRLQAAIRSQAPISHSTVLFPESAESLQPFLQALGKLDPSRQSLQNQRAVDIRILDAAPINLDTMFVTVERNLLRHHDDVQSKFGGGFTHNAAGAKSVWGLAGKASENKRNSKKPAVDTEQRLTAAVREALTAQKIVHTGDVLPLPLPAHPITYMPAPPARITFCEPVSQGLLMPTTNIVLIQSRPTMNRPHQPLLPRSVSLQQVAEDEADDTSNEQFYSAAEDKPGESGTEMGNTSAAEDSETEGSDNSVSDSSDESLEDMISLSAPELPQTPSGILSSITSATPRAGGRRVDGVHTPGSVASNFTSATMRPGRNTGKVFKVEGLLQPVPNEVLHPRPRDDEDVDSFVFVDISTLAKIGCFSGDWVRIEAAEEPQLNIFASLKLGSFNESPEDLGDWRPVKVFGLPDLPSPKPRYAINHSGDRRSSFSQRPPTRLTPSVFVPPLLLSNIENPKYLRISPMNFAAANGSSKAGLWHQMKAAAKNPPLAKEVTLLKVSTPLSMDRILQPALFAGLKHYFESRRRILKSGDLVGISVDEGLGRAVFSGTSGDGANQEDDITSRLGQSPGPGLSEARKVGVAWFRVGQVTPTSIEELDDTGEDHWGGVAVIDPSSTRMVQAGSDISRIPGVLRNGWEYWLGVRTIPKSASDVPAPHGIVADPPQPFIAPLQQRIRDLMSAATSPRAIQLGMKPVVILLRAQQRHIGKATLATRACADIGLHVFPIDAYDILTEGGANGGDVKTEAYLKARAERAFHCGSNCTALLIKHIEVLTADRMVTAMADIINEARLIIATTTDVEQIPEGIRSMFTHEFEMGAPEEREREGILRNAVAERGIKLSSDVDLGTVALKTAALVAGDLVDVVERAAGARSTRLEKLAEAASKQRSGSKVCVRDVLLAGGEGVRGVTKADFDAAVEAARKNFADSIGAPKIPNVSWEDVGGLSNVKDALVETIQLPLERPELFAKGMKKRSGILFYGPPGTGKTLLAKAIATEFSLNFFSVKGPELLNMYIGESEANVRRVFQRARDARPCVVFFDELDSVAPKRGNQGDSGGVMDRIVSQLLAELDGMNGGEENSGGVFVIGATNRPDLLDTALLRPGRFDKMLYLGVSDTHRKQATILEALTRKFVLNPDVSLERVAERLPLTYTGADLYALCSDAMLKAITRKSTAVDDKIKQLPGGLVSTDWFFDHLATSDDVSVTVTEDDFFSAQTELVPSVSAKELEHFERIRQTFESVDKQKQDSSAAAPQTIAEAMEAFSLGASPSLDEVPMTNGDHSSSASINGGIKGLKQWPGGIVHSDTTGCSTPSSKGKGKGVGKEAEDALTGNESDVALDGDDEDMADDHLDSEDGEGEDDYVVRTGHLSNAIEKVE